MAVWQSPDVRFRFKMFGTGQGTRWQPPEIRNTIPVPDLDIRFIMNWADVVFAASDFSSLSTVTLLNPDELE